MYTVIFINSNYNNKWLPLSSHPYTNNLTVHFTIYSFSNPHTHQPAHSPISPPTHPSVRPLTHQSSHSPISPPTHPLVRPLTHQFSHSVISPPTPYFKTYGNTFLRHNLKLLFDPLLVLASLPLEENSIVMHQNKSIQGHKPEGLLHYIPHVTAGSSL